MRAEDTKNRGEEMRILLDFNAIDADSCWVSGGSNATCPYSDMEGREAMDRQTLLVGFFSLTLFLSSNPSPPPQR